MLKYGLLLIVFCIVSCAATLSSTNDNEVLTAPQKGQMKSSDILGDWVWVKTHCCGRLMNIVIDTAKTKTIISFTKDGQQISYQGNEVVRTKSYEFYIDENLGGPALKLEDMVQPGLLSLRGDTLVINYGYMDLQTDFYVKTKR